MGRKSKQKLQSKPSRSRPRRRSHRQPVRQGQKLQRQCALCGYGMVGEVCSNRQCERSHPKPKPNVTSAEMRQREDSGLWVPPWYERDRP